MTLTPTLSPYLVLITELIKAGPPFGRIHQEVQDGRKRPGRLDEAVHVTGAEAVALGRVVRAGVRAGHDVTPAGLRGYGVRVTELGSGFGVTGLGLGLRLGRTGAEAVASSEHESGQDMTSLLRGYGVRVRVGQVQRQSRRPSE